MASAVLDTALTLRGIPYQFGGADPARGFDCSGLVHWVLAQHRIELPRTAAEQFDAGVRVGPGNIAPGDLVFFSTIAPGPSHVGIALDDRTFVHAPASGGVVRVERFDTSYWRARFLGVRRVIGPIWD